MNKTVLAQINTIAGDINGNATKIINCINQAKECNADLIIFPAYSLCGYPYRDILNRHTSLITCQNQKIEEIAKHTQNITVIIGIYSEQKNHFVIIQNNKIIKNTNVFSINNETFAVISKIKNLQSDYELINTKLNSLIICDVSPSKAGYEFIKNNVLSNFAKNNSLNLIYVNKSGYSDNYVFDGASRIYNNKGELILRAKSFEEDFAIANNYSGDINPIPAGADKQFVFDNFNFNYQDDLERTYNSIVYAIKEYFSKNGFKKAVLGLSGGLDSTISAVLLVDALGAKNVVGISMPSKITSQESKNDAEILAKNLGITFLETPLAEAFEPLKSMLNKTFDKINMEKYQESTTIENLQARLRATLLWSVSNEFKQMLPIATSDKSEAYIGYATVNGDMSGGFAPIADVTKTKLFALGHFLNEHRLQKNAIPQSVLEKPPGAELKINPKTGKTVFAEEANMPYEFLDEIIWLVENKHYDYNKLSTHKFYYETHNDLSQEQKNEWIEKFYKKMQFAIYKWHILPPSVIVDTQTINSAEYRQPILSKIY